ncbi:MAG: hypothetical protein R3D25_02425 [Geminicoccaceae bacterium]
MIRRLGARRWKLLHRLVYGVAAVAVVHFFMQTKLDATEPWIIAGLLAWLLAARVVIRKGALNGWLADWWPLALGLVASAGTAIGEALYYRALVGVAPSRMLAANLSIEAGIRPAGYVLASSTRRSPRDRRPPEHVPGRPARPRHGHDRSRRARASEAIRACPASRTRRVSARGTRALRTEWQAQPPPTGGDDGDTSGHHRGPVRRVVQGGTFRLPVASSP